jgi:tetratricopeptide (TPR) repeat protein
MPFGRRQDSTGNEIDFDAVYGSVLKPAVEAAGMTPIRGDEEQLGGIIHKAIFERLILCDYALADLTMGNPNVLYELGVRHGIRPRTTVSVFAAGTRLPFDVAPLRCIPYSVSGGAPSKAAEDIQRIGEALAAATEGGPDSPVFQLVSDLTPPDVAHLKTDLFREQAVYSDQVRAELAAARSNRDVAAVDAIRTRMGDLAAAETGVAIDILLSYRALSAWTAMIEAFEELAPPVQRSTLVREQHALALNRAGRDEEAEHALLDLIGERGASSETYGLLGRVYKDRWENAVGDGRALEAIGFLEKAIAAYRKGFEADWRDAYPGINAVTLMELAEPPDPERLTLVPVVRYSAARHLNTDQPDYWDVATLLELAVLAEDRSDAEHRAAEALALGSEGWQFETTARNLRLILSARVRRGEPVEWLEAIVAALDAKVQSLR